MTLQHVTYQIKIYYESFFKSNEILILIYIYIYILLNNFTALSELCQYTDMIC